MSTLPLIVLFAGSDRNEPVARATLRDLEILSVYGFGPDHKTELDVTFLDVEKKGSKLPDGLRDQKSFVIALVSPELVMSQIVTSGAITELLEGYGKTGLCFMPVNTIAVPQSAKMPWSHINPLVLTLGDEKKALTMLNDNPYNLGAKVADKLCAIIDKRLRA